MSLELMSLILLGGLILLLAIGTEIYVAMGIMAALGLMLFVGQPLRQFGFTAFDVMNSFILTAMPLSYLWAQYFPAPELSKGFSAGRIKSLEIYPGALPVPFSAPVVFSGR